MHCSSFTFLSPVVSKLQRHKVGTTEKLICTEMIGKINYNHLHKCSYLRMWWCTETRFAPSSSLWTGKSLFDVWVDPYLSASLMYELPHMFLLARMKAKKQQWYLLFPTHRKQTFVSCMHFGLPRWNKAFWTCLLMANKMPPIFLPLALSIMDGLCDYVVFSQIQSHMATMNDHHFLYLFYVQVYVLNKHSKSQ